MTPKSLLRHPRAVSPLDEFTTGPFRRVIPDSDPDRQNVEGRAALLRQDLLRAGKRAAKTWAGATWRSSAWSSSIRCRCPS